MNTLTDEQIKSMKEELERFKRPTDCPFTFDYRLKRRNEIEKILKKYGGSPVG